MSETPMDEIDRICAGLTCPNCANREKADVHWDENGGDFWHCTAVAILPAFTGHFYDRQRYPGERSVDRLINLKLFEPGSTYADHVNAKACPLFAVRARLAEVRS